MITPKVSIVVPCYGVEKYLDRCMESLVNQTLRDIEIILVDDGSPDRVPEMCDEWAKKDARIKVIHKNNAGLGYARNSGLEIATGEYVAFVDSDDYVDKKMYDSLFNEAELSHADVVFCGFYIEQKSNYWIESKEVTEKTIFNTKEDVERFMLDMIASAPHVTHERKYQMSVWHSIYKHSIIIDNRIRFHSERKIVSEDIPFQVDYLKQAKTVVYLPDYFYYYCLNSTSLTTTYSPEKYNRFKTLRNLLRSQLNEIKEGNDRANRIFIGYVRSNIIKLLSSNRTDKDIILTNIINDDIWKEIEKEYPATNLPIYAQIIYHLICKKQKMRLRIFVWLVDCLRETMNKSRG